jgi:signal transduction histidine kinase
MPATKDAPIDVAGLFDALLVRVQDLAASRRIRLFVGPGSGEVRGDSRALTEVLSIIVTNAIESSPAGGSVVVSSRETRAHRQLWQVRDSGSGIPRHVFPFVGTPFFRRSNTESGGAVALAREIVHRHGGRTWVISRPSLGTLVSILLPSAVPQPR